MGRRKNRRTPGPIQRVCFYARVSTPGQAEKDLSIPAQITALTDHATAHGYVVERTFVEPGASGTDDHRRVFREMIAWLLGKDCTVDAVLVWASSRFMRDAALARLYKSQLQKHGVRVISITQQTTDDPSGRMMEGIFELFDQYESELNGARTTAAMRENARRGNFNGSRPPYGFHVVKREERSGISRNKLMPDDEERGRLRELCMLYVGGSGALGAARELNRRGLTYRGGKPWTKNLVLKALADSAIVGRYYWGKGTNTRTDAEEIDPDWVLIPVEPLIDETTWAAVRRVRAQRDPEKSPGKTSSSPLLLAGLAKCGKCGASYQLQTSGKPSTKYPHGYRYYNCRSVLRGGKICVGGAIPVELLERAVREHLAQHYFTEEHCKALVRELVEESAVFRQRTDDRRQLLQKELADVDARISRWLEAFEKGAFDPQVGMERVHELRARRTELQETLRKVIPLRPPPESLTSDAAVRRFRSSLQSILQEENNGLAKSYLRFLVEEVVIDGDTVRIVARKDAALEVMATGTAGSPAPALTGSAEVRATVLDWLQLLDSNQRPGG